MKKLFLLMLCAAMALSMTACGEKKDDETANILQQYYQNDDVYYSHLADHYEFRLPNFWKGKHIIDVFKGREDFYEVTSYDTDGTGLLFSIIEYEDESYKKDLKGKNYTYLGHSELYNLHFVLLLPDEEKYVEEATEQYADLKKGINIAKSTFTIY